jgi:hypothetical protein
MSSEKPVSHWLPCPVVFLSVESGEKREIMTATAMFVSEGDPLLAISVAKGHLTHRLIAEAKQFTLTIASESQRSLALQLGSIRGDEGDKFRRFAIETVPNKSGKAIIPKGASAWMDCKVIRGGWLPPRGGSGCGARGPRESSDGLAWRRLFWAQGRLDGHKSCPRQTESKASYHLCGGFDLVDRGLLRDGTLHGSVSW